MQSHQLLRHKVRYGFDSLLHLLYPHRCAGCGTDLLARNQTLCVHCIAALPATGFEQQAGNPIEKMFWGRLPLRHASAQFFFTKDSLLQHLLHQLKYGGNKELGKALGLLAGKQLAATDSFGAAALLIPLPLHPQKEHLRGYNQATLICAGMATTLHKPVVHDAVIRTHHTESQTRKSRVDRWQNMEGRFLVTQPGKVAGKHVLLVDDVVTTGATLEACGQALVAAGATVSIATLCCAFH